MNNPQFDPAGGDQLAIEYQVDRICDSFESSWKQGHPPDIESFLSETTKRIQPIVFAELMKLDIHYRQLSGDLISLEVYQSRFPQYSNILQEFGDVLSTSIQKPKKIGRFRLDRIVGRGAFGLVWKAWDEDLQRTVAIKIPRKRNLSPDELDRFIREAKAAARLSHPGIVSIYDFEEIKGVPLLVSEFIEGSTLQDWASHNEVHVFKAAMISRDIALALQAAHEKSVVHRDLKPNNVLVRDDGQIQITDFGLAKRVDTESTIAIEGAILGTFTYMSPEQANGQSSSVDRRSDIYSLGAILYELLTSRVPFKGTTSKQMIYQILQVEPVPPRKWNGSIPRDLETICLKAMCKVPSDRYDSASELAEDLQRFIDHKPIHARRISLLGKLWRWGKRNRVLSGAYIIICLLLFSGMATFMVMYDDGKWQVNIETDPPGAHVLVYPRNAISGEPDITTAIKVPGTSPNSLRLTPGEYYVAAMLEGTPRFQHVFRMAPPLGTGRPMGSTKNRSWKHVNKSAIKWPVIIIPPQSVQDDMIFIKGSPGVVPDIYVSLKEFTNQDFLQIRPGIFPTQYPRQSPPDDPYFPNGQDSAIHFAEEAGGRLMTVNEFEHIVRSLPMHPNLQGFLRNGSEWTSSQATPELISKSSAALKLLPEFRTPEFIGLAVSRDRNSNSIDDKSNLDLNTPFSINSVVRYGKNSHLGFRLVRNAAAVPQLKQPTK